MRICGAVLLLLGLVVACAATSVEKNGPPAIAAAFAGTLNHFTAKGTAKFNIRACGKQCAGATCNKALACGTTATTYTFQMYQKMDASGNWDLRGRVEISGDGPTTISYYKTPHVVSGVMGSGGFDEKTCSAIAKDDFFQSGITDPQLLLEPKALSALRSKYNLPNSTQGDCFTVKLGGQSMSVLAVRKPGQFIPSPTGYSKFYLHNKDVEIVIEQFEPGKNSVTIPNDVDFGLCDPFKLQPIAPPNTVKPPRGFPASSWLKNATAAFDKVVAITKEAIAQQQEQIRAVRKPSSQDFGRGMGLMPISYPIAAPSGDTTYTSYFYDLPTAVVFKTKQRGTGKQTSAMPSIASATPIPRGQNVNFMVASRPRAAPPSELGDFPTARRDTVAVFVEEYIARADSSADALHHSEQGGTCADSFKGDGYCDEACNNAQQNWDNGDCCRGLCEDAKYACGHNGFQCKQKGTKKCLFLHGLGQDGPASGVGTFANFQMADGHRSLGIEWYWGDLAAELEGVCSEVIFNLANTNGKGWDDAGLQNNYYNKAKEISDGGGIVFAHSMGNNVLAGACLDQSKCVKWHSLSGPLRGAKAANTQDAVTFWNKDGGGLGSLVLQFRGNMLATQQRDALARTVAEKNLQLSALCGYDAWGSGGRVGAALWAARDVVAGTYYCSRTRRVLGLDVCVEWSTVEHDGLVGFNECSAYGTTSGQTYYNGDYVRDYKAKYYKFRGNHQDSTGARGNHDHFYDHVRYVARRRNS